MTSKDKKLKAILELVSVQGRIDELKRSKTYFSSSTYYRNRLTTLQNKEEVLNDIIEGKDKDDVEELKFTLHFNIPEGDLKDKRDPEDFIQYLKREYLVKG